MTTYYNAQSDWHSTYERPERLLLWLGFVEDFDCPKWVYSSSFGSCRTAGQDKGKLVGQGLFWKIRLAASYSAAARGVLSWLSRAAFLDHARLALIQVEAAVEAARRTSKPIKKRFALGFLTGLAGALQVLREDLPWVDVTVSSDYSPDLAEGMQRGRLEIAFMRAEPNFDLAYALVGREPLAAGR
jgi:hypothetical protein